MLIDLDVLQGVQSALRCSCCRFTSTTCCCRLSCGHRLFYQIVSPAAAVVSSITIASPANVVSPANISSSANVASPAAIAAPAAIVSSYAVPSPATIISPGAITCPANVASDFAIPSSSPHLPSSPLLAPSPYRHRRLTCRLTMIAFHKTGQDDFDTIRNRRDLPIITVTMK